MRWQYILAIVLVAILVCVLIGLGVWQGKKKADSEKAADDEAFRADVQKTYAKITSVPETMVGGASPRSAIGDYDALEDPIEATWQERMRDQHVDPEVFGSHKRFTNDIAVYSRGAARTSLVSDYRTTGLTNYQGLIRPVAVPRRKGILNQVSENEADFERARTLVW